MEGEGEQPVAKIHKPCASYLNRTAMKRRFSIATEKLKLLLQETQQLQQKERGLEEDCIKLQQLSEEMPDVVEIVREKKERLRQERLKKEDENKAVKAELENVEDELKQAVTLQVEGAIKALDQGINQGDQELHALLYRPMVTYVSAVMERVYDPHAKTTDDDSTAIKEVSTLIQAKFADHPVLAARIQQVITDYFTNRTDDSNKGGAENDDGKDDGGECDSQDGTGQEGVYENAPQSVATRPW